MQSSVHWIIVCANGAAMSIKLYNSWLFWWYHPSSQLQWEFDSHSPPVRLIWWWFFAYRVHNQGERELSPQSQKIFWWFHLLCFSLTVLLVSLFFFGEGVKDYWCGKAAFWPLFFNPSGIWSWSSGSSSALPEKNTLEPNLMRLSKQT